MEISEVGEFGLIDRLSGLLGPTADGEVWSGDDTAVIRAPAGTLLYTCDLMVEGVHFDLELTGPSDLGYKSIAVNMSDIAAMGGTPRRAVVGLVVRDGIDVEWLEELIQGMRTCCDEFGSAVVGGDVSKGDCLTIFVALIGNPAGRRFVERSGARVGDAVCVTGTLGASAAGYRLARSGQRDFPHLVASHLRPKPRVSEAVALRRFLPSAMIDISDGFVADLGHICRMSSVGAVIDADALPSIDQVDGLDRTPLELALHGGEDYELCFTMPADRWEDAASQVEAETGTKVVRVGEIIEGQGVHLASDGNTVEVQPKGWDHFRP